MRYKLFTNYKIGNSLYARFRTSGRGELEREPEEE